MSRLSIENLKLRYVLNLIRHVQEQEREANIQKAEHRGEAETDLPVRDCQERRFVYVKVCRRQLNQQTSFRKDSQESQQN